MLGDPTTTAWGERLHLERGTDGSRTFTRRLEPDVRLAATLAARGQLRGTLIEAAVAELPPDLRLVFLMHEASGLSLQDIARDLSLPLGTVKTRLMRARHRLRRIITDRIHGGFETIFPFAGTRCSAMAEKVVVLLRQRQMSLPGRDQRPD